MRKTTGNRNLSPARQLAGLAAWLLLTFFAAWIGSVASITAPEFYAELKQPSWAPPASVFGPVWGALYFLMAISAWLTWRSANLRAGRVAYILYVAQLAFNSLWSWLFFSWQLGGLAFADILVLWALIASTIVAFTRIRPIAAWLLLPYLLWVSFAAFLNFAVWRMNPALLG